MQIDFNEELHEYRIDGKIVPSATQVIGQVLPGFDAGDYYKQRGRALHLACELADANKLNWQTVHPEIEGKIRAWLKFRADWPKPILATEKKIGHSLYMFAGRIDRVCDDKDHVVVDLKSTNTPQVKVQLGFYSLGWKQLYPKTTTRGVSVELRNDGTYRALWLKADELRRHEQIALNCLGVYNFMKLNNLKGK